MDSSGPAQRFGADLRQTDVADITSLHHIGDGSHGLLDRDVWIEPGGPIDVDVIDAEAVERIGQEGFHRCGPGVIPDPAAGRITLRAELDADERPAPLVGTQSFRNQKLVVTHPVEVAGIQKSDTGVEGRVDRRDTLGAIRGAVHAGHAHAAQPKCRHGGAVQPARA